MELIRIRCTNCGAEFDNVEEGQLYFRCTRKGCGAVFMTDLGREFAAIEKSRADQIQRLRKGLKENLTPFRKEQVKVYAEEILSMIPGDFRAEVSLCLCCRSDGDVMPLRQLLEGPVRGTAEEFTEMFPCILENCEYRELLALEKAAMQYLSGNAMAECQSAIDQRREEVFRKNNDYADVPRDVFICYSSADQAMADDVVRLLEDDGCTCWISSRNLPPDSPDYHIEIENAIIKCKIFLVLTDRASMLSKDVQNEISLAEKHGNLRLELKLDSEPHTTLFRYFFDGISWIDASDGSGEFSSHLKTRIYDLLHQNISAASTTENNQGRADVSAAVVSAANIQNESKKTAMAAPASSRFQKGIIPMLILVILMLLLFLQNSDSFWSVFTDKVNVGNFGALYGGALAVKAYSLIAAGDICILSKRGFRAMSVFTAAPGILLFLYITIYNAFAAASVSVLPSIYTTTHMRAAVIVLLTAMAVVLLVSVLLAALRFNDRTAGKEAD